MEFRVLGRAAVEIDGQEVPLAGRSRSLLAVFLLRPRHCYEHRELGDALYEPEVRHTDEMVRRAVCRLRASLGPPKDALPGRISTARRDLAMRVQTLRAGYLMLVEDEELDLAQFTTLVARGEAAADRRDLAQAERALDAALNLWQDEEPLADVPDSGANYLRKNYLLERRAAAEEKLIDVRLELGKHLELMPELRARAAAEPTNERAQAQLILALYRCDRGAEALDVASRTFHALKDQLGFDPGPALEELVAAIRRRDPLLTGGTGGGSVALLPPAPLVPRFQIPAPPADFAGRDLEVGDLVKRLNGAPLLTLITGPAAAGKSALAAYVAGLVMSAFPDGQFWVDLGGDENPREPSDILHGLLINLGAREGGIPPAAEDRASMYRGLLADRRVLIVADNATRAGQVLPLLPGRAGSSLLVTSRSPLTEAARRTALITSGPAHVVTLSPRPSRGRADATEVSAELRSVPAAGLAAEARPAAVVGAA